MAPADRPGSTGTERLASDLAALDARTWAQVLRALRRVDPAPGSLVPLLERPTSALAAGPDRDRLCRLLAAEPDLIAALRSDPALPAGASSVLAAGVPQPTEVTPAVSDGRAGDDVASPTANAASGAASRERALRRDLVETRRQRDGAEARASLAETRARDAEEVIAGLEERLEALHVQLAQAQDAVTTAVARAERRSAARAAELERALAAERSALEELRRERDRDRAALDAALATLGELEDLRARQKATAPPSSGPRRPLVLPDALEPDTTAAARWLLDGASVLLVDGYNVSLALRSGHPLVEQRRWLIDRLRPLVARGRATPVIVFDGEGSGRTQRDPSGVEVRFTASGTIADDEIVFSVAATDEPVLVVTDDAELQERVRAEGGNVLGTVHLLGAIEG